jgi:DNA-directed RNA polymerase II subunit RPB3
MQTYEDSEPIVRIRDYKQDRVNFVLENVDLAYALQLYVTNLAE